MYRLIQMLAAFFIMKKIYSKVEAFAAKKMEDGTFNDMDKEKIKKFAKDFFNYAYPFILLYFPTNKVLYNWILSRLSPGTVLTLAALIKLFAAKK